MKKIIIITAVFLIGVYFGRNSNDIINADEKQGYPYLARRLTVENPTDVIINFLPLRHDLNRIVEAEKGKTGVYFEYLPTGISIGIYDKKDFFRASLVKVPVVMKTYKLREEGRIKFTDKITLKDYHKDPAYGTVWQSPEGREMTVQELIYEILANSDNTAYEMLVEYVDSVILGSELGQEKSLDDVYDYLDIPREEETVSAFITPKNFSSILKSLYFSSYLSYSDSNEILSLLTQSKYVDGIHQNIPENIKVAHKFGIYNVENQPFKVTSDCGIFFVPKRPYILCVMSEENENKKQVFSEISSRVYEYISGL